MALLVSAGVVLGAGILYFGRSPRISPKSPVDTTLASRFERLLESREPVYPQSVEATNAGPVRAAFEKHARGEQLSRDELLELFQSFEEADGQDCFTLWSDFDADSHEDLILKRYWSGSGSAFDLIILKQSGEGYVSYVFHGGERGISFYHLGGGDELLRQQVVDLDRDGTSEVIMPACLSDRGAGTVANWPTIYKFKSPNFEIGDSLFSDFYRAELLPKLDRREADPDTAEDLQGIRVLVSRLTAPGS